MTYKLKIHNPWLLFLILILSILLPILLLNKFGEGVSMIASIVFVLADMSLAYKFLGKTIDVELSESGVSTTWTKAPFFTYCYEDITWGDILYWDFQSAKMMDIFSITTRNGQTLYIRCIDLSFRQEQLSSFIQSFKDKVDAFNEHTLTTDNRIQSEPSIFARPVGQVFAVVIFIALIFLTYEVKTYGLNSDSASKVIFAYLAGFFWIGMTISFYLKKRNKQ
jgi:hypothetical protein